MKTIIIWLFSQIATFIVESIAIGYKNSENRKDKINYYNYTRTTGYRVNHKNYTSQGTFTDTYRVNTRTGKEKLIGSKASDTRIFKENAK